MARPFHDSALPPRVASLHRVYATLPCFTSCAVVPTTVHTTIVARDTSPVHHDAYHDDNVPGARPRPGPLPTAHVAEYPLRAYPMPLGDVGLPPPSDRSVLTPSRRPPCPAATSRYLLGSPPPATSPGSATPVRASPVTGFRTSPSCTVHSTVAASASASGSLLRTIAVGSVCLLGTPRFTPSGSGANDHDTDRRRADLVRASVLNTLPCANVPTTVWLVAPGDIVPLTPSVSLRSPPAPFTSASWALASHHHRSR